jgi:hypothetical protein
LIKLLYRSKSCVARQTLILAASICASTVPTDAREVAILALAALVVALALPRFVLAISKAATASSTFN